MTIKRGEEWGTPFTAPSVVTHLGSDADIATMEAGETMIVTGGDLYETLGCPAIAAPGSTCTLVSVDALQCEVFLPDGTVVIQRVASCIEIGFFRPRLGRQHRYVCVSNAGLVKGRNLLPRAHPNDGVMDVLEVASSMTIRNRLVANKKAETGTHIPHPNITTARGTMFEFENLGESEDLQLDHTKIPSWVKIRVSVLPDYWNIVV